jgi:DNA-dependent protein kinase catalytic subunit
VLCTCVLCCLIKSYSINSEASGGSQKKENDSDGDDDSVATGDTEKTENNEEDDLAALNTLDEGTEETPSQDEVEMWRHRSMDCLKQLCDWEQVHATVEVTMQNSAADEGMSDHDVAELMASLKISPTTAHQRQQLLPSYLCALVHSGERRKEEFSKFIDQALLGGDFGAIKEAVESGYPADVATCFALRGDWSRVRVYTEMAFLQFGDRWRSLHPCAIGARRGLLRGLQRIVELDDAASYRSSSSAAFDSRDGPRCKERLLKSWCQSQPHVFDPTWLWDEIICGRKIALRNSADIEGPEFTADVASHLSSLHISTASAAVEQGIMQAVQPQLLASNALKKLLPVKKEKMSLDEVRIVCNWNSKSIPSKAESEAKKTFKTTLDLLDRPTEGGDLDKVPLLLMKAEWLSRWAVYERSQSRGGAEGTGILEKNKRALETYQSAASLADATCSSSMDSKENVWTRVSTGQRSDAYGRLARHCDQQLRALEAQAEAGGLSNSPALNSLAQQTVDAFVVGMQLENSYCRDRLLRLTSLTGKYPHTASSLLSGLSAVPSWSFIKFAPQLMGSLDLPEGPVAAALLEKVARAYPRALYYPFYITSEFLGPKGLALSAGELTQSLKDPGQENFVQSLGGLTHPELRWSDGLKAINKVYGTDLVKARTLYEALYDDVLMPSWSKVRTYTIVFRDLQLTILSSSFSSVMCPNDLKVSFRIHP